jgi:hypothetical protein
MLQMRCMIAAYQAVVCVSIVGWWSIRLGSAGGDSGCSDKNAELTSIELRQSQLRSKGTNVG